MDYKIIRESELNWLSGLFDGEGSVYISRTKGKNTHLYNLSLEITMTDKPTIEKIHNLFGIGSFNPTRRKTMNKKHRQAWRWSAKSNDAVKILELITPSLVTKKDEAILALEFAKSRGKNPGRRGMDEETARVREDYYQRMKELKLKEWVI